MRNRWEQHRHTLRQLTSSRVQMSCCEAELINKFPAHYTTRRSSSQELTAWERKTDRSEDLCVDVRILLKWMLSEIGLEAVGWLHLIYNRDRWWVVMNAALDYQFHKRRVISWLAERTVTFLRRTMFRWISMVWGDVKKCWTKNITHSVCLQHEE
jgi:hypothetical protein